MNVLIEVNAFEATGNQLANLAVTEITKCVSMKIGKDILPDLLKKENEIQDIDDLNKRNDGYDDNII